MVQYWVLSYPRGNMEISIKEELIGGRKRQPGYEKRYSLDLNLGDRLILYIQREYLVKGVVTISSDYFFDETPVWPIVNDETYPHRRRIPVPDIGRPPPGSRHGTRGSTPASSHTPQSLRHRRIRCLTLRDTCLQSWRLSQC